PLHRHPARPRLGQHRQRRRALGKGAAEDHALRPRLHHVGLDGVPHPEAEDAFIVLELPEVDHRLAVAAERKERRVRAELEDGARHSLADARHLPRRSALLLGLGLEQLGERLVLGNLLEQRASRRGRDRSSWSGLDRSRLRLGRRLGCSGRCALCGPASLDDPRRTAHDDQRALVPAPLRLPCLPARGLDRRLGTRGGLGARRWRRSPCRGRGRSRTLATAFTPRTLIAAAVLSLATTPSGDSQHHVPERRPGTLRPEATLVRALLLITHATTPRFLLCNAGTRPPGQGRRSLHIPRSRERGVCPGRTCAQETLLGADTTMAQWEAAASESSRC